MNYQEMPFGAPVPQPSYSAGGIPRNLTLEKFILIETGSYDDQYTRPYNVSLNGSNFNSIVEAFREDPLNPDSKHIATTAGSSLMQVSSRPETVSNIPNGWGTRRYRYMMELKYEIDSAVNREVILGYCEHYDGVGIGDLSIDPNMKFYVNSVVKLRESPIMLNNFVKSNTTVYETNQVIHDPCWGDKRSPVINNSAYYTIRPYDIAKGAQTFKTDGDASNFGEVVVDTRAIVGNNKPAISNRRNNVGSNYFNAMLNGFESAMLSSGQNYRSQEFNTQMLNSTQDNPYDRTIFLRKLRDYEKSFTAAFTMRDLYDIFPNTKYVTHIVRMSTAQRAAETYQRGNAEAWHASDSATHFAATISQAVPSIMAELGLTKLGFVSTNRSIGSQVNTTVIMANGFGGISTAELSERFKVMFNMYVIPGLTYNNAIDYALTCEVDLTGESKLQVSVNGEPDVPYVIPSFADSLMTPILTKNPNLVYETSAKFDNLYQSLETVVHDALGTYSNAYPIHENELLPNMPNSDWSTPKIRSFNDPIYNQDTGLEYKPSPIGGSDGYSNYPNSSLDKRNL